MHVLMRYTGLLCFFLFGLVTPGKSQQFALARTYGIEEGLSHPFIAALDTDSRGNLWVGNRRGLQRFNGFDFKTYFSGSNVIAVSCYGNNVFYVTEKGTLNYLHYDNTEYTTHTLLNLPVCNGDTYNVLAENDQYFWYSVCDKLFLFDLRTKSSIPVRLPEKYENIRVILRSPKGLVLKTSFGMIYLACDRSKKQPVVTAINNMKIYSSVQNFSVFVQEILPIPLKPIRCSV